VLAVQAGMSSSRGLAQGASTNWQQNQIRHPGA